MKKCVTVAIKGDVVLAKSKSLSVIYETSGDILGVLASQEGRGYYPIGTPPRAVDGSIIYMQEGDTHFKVPPFETSEEILQNFISEKDYQPYVIVKLTEEEVNEYYEKIPTI